MLEMALQLGSNLGVGTILLIGVLFLYKNVPAWVKKHFDLIERMGEAHKEETRELAKTFRDEIREERDQCQAHNDRMGEILEESNRSTVEAFRSLSNQLSQHHGYMADSVGVIRREMKG